MAPSCNITNSDYAFLYDKLPDGRLHKPLLWDYNFYGETRQRIQERKGKVVPGLFLNWIPRHESVLGSGVIAPRILWPRNYLKPTFLRRIFSASAGIDFDSWQALGSLLSIEYWALWTSYDPVRNWSLQSVQGKVRSVTPVVCCGSKARSSSS